MSNTYRGRLMAGTKLTKSNREQHFINIKPDICRRLERHAESCLIPKGQTAELCIIDYNWMYAAPIFINKNKTLQNNAIKFHTTVRGYKTTSAESATAFSVVPPDHIHSIEHSKQTHNTGKKFNKIKKGLQTL